MTTTTRPTRPARPAAPVDADGALDWSDRPTRLTPRPVVPAAPPAAPAAAALTPEAARARFYGRYGAALIGALLGSSPIVEPETAEGWVEIARAVKAVLAAQEQGRKKS